MIIVSGGSVVENGFIYDLDTHSAYVSTGMSKSQGWPVSASVAAVKIIASDSSIDLRDPKIRNEIITGESISISGYYGIGGGIEIPVNSKYYGRVKLVITGIGTPQIGGNISSTSDTSDKVNQIHEQIQNDKYGLD